MRHYLALLLDKILRLFRITKKCISKNRTSILIVFLTLLSLGIIYAFVILKLPQLTSQLAQILISAVSDTYGVLLEKTIYLFIVLAIYYIIVRGTSSKNWLEQNQGAIASIGLAFSVVIFLIQQTSVGFEKEVERLLKFKKNEHVLMVENSKTLHLLKNLAQDMSKDPYTIYWNTFTVENYEISLDHIRLYYSPICEVKYYNLIGQINALIRLNEIKQDTFVSNETTYSTKLAIEIINTVSTTQSVLLDVQTSCRGLTTSSLPYWYQMPPGLNFLESSPSTSINSG